MGKIADSDAALSAWHQWDEPYERLPDCEGALRGLLSDEERYNDGKPPEERKILWNLARCVASDDPRLKEK